MLPATSSRWPRTIRRSSSDPLEIVARLPAQLFDLGRVHRIAAVVAGAVLDVGDQILALAEQFQDAFGHVDVELFVARADVVDLADARPSAARGPALRPDLPRYSQSRTCLPSPYTGTGLFSIRLVVNSGISFSGYWNGP